MKTESKARIEGGDMYEHQKRQYRKALEIWREKTDQEYQVYCEKKGKKLDPEKLKKWRGLLYIISECEMEAYSAGIDGAVEPDIIAKIEALSEEVADEYMGREFFEAVAGIIRSSYFDGQEARRR